MFLNVVEIPNDKRGHPTNAHKYATLDYRHGSEQAVQLTQKIRVKALPGKECVHPPCILRCNILSRSCDRGVPTLDRKAPPLQTPRFAAKYVRAHRLPPSSPRELSSEGKDELTLKCIHLQVLKTCLDDRAPLGDLSVTTLQS